MRFEPGPAERLAFQKAAGPPGPGSSEGSETPVAETSESGVRKLSRTLTRPTITKSDRAP